MKIQISKPIRVFVLLYPNLICNQVNKNHQIMKIMTVSVPLLFVGLICKATHKVDFYMFGYCFVTFDCVNYQKPSLLY